MSRRGFLLLAKREPVRIPGLEQLEELNKFAEQYNRYVSALQRGVQDLGRWRAVLDSWKRLTEE